MVPVSAAVSFVETSVVKFVIEYLECGRETTLGSKQAFAVAQTNGSKADEADVAFAACVIVITP